MKKIWFYTVTLVLSSFIWVSCSSQQNDECGKKVEEAVNLIGEGKTEEGIKILTEEAEKGCLDAESFLGAFYTIQQNYDEAFKWTYKAAQHGNGNAQYSLGELYSHGYGTEIDLDKAFKYYLEAAEKDSPLAYKKVALAYAAGYGTEKNEKEAFKWAKKAGKTDDGESKFVLAQFYAMGIGTNVDLKKAFSYYEEAAEMSFIPAVRELGRCYLTGSGVEQQHEKGLTYMYIAAKAGDEEANDLIETLKTEFGDVATELLNSIDQYLNEK